MTSKEIALQAAESLYKKGAQNITVLDVSKLTVITEYMVIATGRNVPQAQALAEAVEDTLTLAEIEPLRKDGHAGSRWLVLDYGAVFIHIFLPNEREFYHLDKLWEQDGNAIELPFIQEETSER